MFTVIIILNTLGLRKTSPPIPGHLILTRGSLKLSIPSVIKPLVSVEYGSI